MSGEIVVSEGVPMELSGELRMIRQPELVLEEARRAAVALERVLNSRPKKDIVIFNGNRHLRIEDWQTLAKFYGLFVRTSGCRRVEVGSASGYHAVAEVVDRGGNVVSSGEGLCLSDEENWGEKPKYEWRDGDNGKRVKVQVGTVAVPEFARMSMAQTRASAKALKNVVAWVVVLAGFAPCAAEEMSGSPDPESEMEMPHEKPAAAPSLGHSASAPAAPRPAAPAVAAPAAPAQGSGGAGSFRGASENQRKAIFAILRAIGIEDDAGRHALTAQFCDGETSSDRISFGQASHFIDVLQECKNGKMKLNFNAEGVPTIG